MSSGIENRQAQLHLLTKAQQFFKNDSRVAMFLGMTRQNYYRYSSLQRELPNDLWVKLLEEMETVGFITVYRVESFNDCECYVSGNCNNDSDGIGFLSHEFARNYAEYQSNYAGLWVVDNGDDHTNFFLDGVDHKTIGDAMKHEGGWNDN